MVDEEVVINYFYLGKRINKTRMRIRQRKQKFDEMNYYPSTFVEDGEPVRRAFRVEPKVVDYVSAQQDAAKHIEIMKFKLRHFNRFLKGLSSESRRYYFYKYKEHAPHINDRLDKLLHEEIAEIEEAVGYRFYDEAAEQRISFNPFEEKGSFEDNFEEMIKRLGV